MGAAAGAGGICRIVLPHYQLDELEALMAWEHPQASASRGPFESLIEQVRAYFNRQPSDFSSLPLDLPGPGTFAGKVYRACAAIPFGQTRSYRELALEIARPDAARAVATTMGKNSLPLVIPCHRVIYSDGRAGGFSAEGGTDLKQRMLAHEAGR
jgi:methylated-DNA-[protein]-cysteine S-methyltransferase